MKTSSYIISTLLFLYITSCGDATPVNSRNTEVSIETTNLHRIIQEIGLNLSNESRVIHFYEPERIIDPVWVAKVIIPDASFETIKDAVEGKRADNSTYSGAIADSTIWWDPTSIIFEKQYLTDDEKFVHFIASRENDGIALYIECAVF